MEVIYHGHSPHGYHSSPSGSDYIFFPGVPLTVKTEDEVFFKNHAKAPGSHWEVVGMEMAEPVREEPKEEPVEEIKPNRRGGRR